MGMSIEVTDLSIGYLDVVLQENISFKVKPSEIFVVMGDSGSGKSTLMRHMVGLLPPVEGDIKYDHHSLWYSKRELRLSMMRQFGVLFQSGALWSSLTLAENIAFPLEHFTSLPKNEIDDLASYKLALVGLAGYEKFYPSEISGGMRKRVGLARAMALDPKVLFCDEPLAGLDPIASKRLDDLILEIRDSLETTIVVVTHELESIFGIADNAIFMDAETHTIIASGNPHDMLKYTDNPKVRQFLTRSQ